MTRLFAVLPMAALLGACATQVTHATKSDAEMRADIQSCTDVADAAHPYDAIGTLRATYACLDSRGYQRGRSGLAAGVNKAVSASGPVRVTPAPQATTGPCQVPCVRRNRP